MIYVDGDHTEEGVYQDAILYFERLLTQNQNGGGYMLFDDYGQSEETKRGIDRFLTERAGRYSLILKGYQVLIRRIW